MTVKEVITLHIGQAGCQTGLEVWELLCHEHEINADGTKEMVDGEELGSMDDPYNSFFQETAAGQHVPRSIFVDTDPSSKEDVSFDTCYIDPCCISTYI